MTLGPRKFTFQELYGLEPNVKGIEPGLKASGRFPEGPPLSHPGSLLEEEVDQLVGRGASTRHMAFQIAVPPWDSATTTSPPSVAGLRGGYGLGE